MDLNELLYHHQVSLIRARFATEKPDRARHRDVARGFADRVASLRGAMNASPAFALAGR